VGSNLVRHLLATDASVRVVAYDALTYAANPSSLAALPPARSKLVVGDVCDEARVRHVLETEAIDTVVHLAAESHVDRAIENPRPFVTTNVVGTASVLQAARAAWSGHFSGRRLHVVSTDEVFGSSSDAAFDEHSRYAPSNPYSATKGCATNNLFAFDATTITTSSNSPLSL